MAARSDYQFRPPWDAVDAFGTDYDRMARVVAPGSSSSSPGPGADCEVRVWKVRWVDARFERAEGLQQITTRWLAPGTELAAAPAEMPLGHDSIVRVGRSRGRWWILQVYGRCPQSSSSLSSSSPAQSSSSLSSSSPAPSSSPVPSSSPAPSSSPVPSSSPAPSSSPGPSSSPAPVPCDAECAVGGGVGAEPGRGGGIGGGVGAEPGRGGGIGGGPPG